jgi:hypothetical protein
LSQSFDALQQLIVPVCGDALSAVQALHILDREARLLLKRGARLIKLLGS